MYRYLALYLIFIAFCAYGIDKKRAVRNQWRISEKALLGWLFWAAASERCWE